MEHILSQLTSLQRFPPCTCPAYAYPFRMQAVSLIAKGYPRGSKQLIGPFKSLFGPEDAAAWFRSRGVRLKTEGDGRMFPVTDDSQTIIDCLEGECVDLKPKGGHIKAAHPTSPT